MSNKLIIAKKHSPPHLPCELKACRYVRKLFLSYTKTPQSKTPPTFPHSYNSRFTLSIQAKTSRHPYRSRFTRGIYVIGFHLHMVCVAPGIGRSQPAGRPLHGPLHSRPNSESANCYYCFMAQTRFMPFHDICGGGGGRTIGSR